jgi:hypothetical protein
MAISLRNYYDQYTNGNLTGLYSQPGGPTIPNPNDPNNNNASKYRNLGNTLGNDPSPLITIPVTKGAIGNSGEGLLSALAGLPGLSGNFGLGLLGSLPLGFEDLAAGKIDTARISKFLYSTPQGLAFNLSQVGLQAMNTKIYHGGPLGGDDFIGRSINDNRIYNLGINTLGQIPLEAIDVHINRHGSLPYMSEYPNNKGVYSEYYKKLDIDTPSSLLNDKKATSTRLLELNNKRIFGLSGRDVELFDEWFSYGGGPKSLFGIGRTSHKRWTKSGDVPKGVITRIQPEIDVISHLEEIAIPSISIISTTALSNGLPKTLKELDDAGLTIQKRSSIGNIASRTIDERKSLSKPKAEARDEINYVSLLKGNSSDRQGNINNALINILGNNQDPNALPKDLVRFRFEAIDNDSVDQSIFIIFRAFLKGISDKYNPNWSSGNYVGRGEKFHVYEGMDRDISFSFTIAPQTRDEMKPLMQKLNFLASNTAPDYNSAGRMRGPFMKLTIGDYFVSLPGFISSLSYDIKDDAPWDIALYKDVENEFGINERQLPHMIDVSVSFKPIHNFLPKKGTNNVFYTLGTGDEWITSMPNIKDWTSNV